MFALVIEAVIHEMTIWIVRIVMPYDDELGIGDAHIWTSLDKGWPWDL